MRELNLSTYLFQEFTTLKKNLMMSKAIVRRPGRTFANGITTSKLGKADQVIALVQHDAYCNALIKCGVELIVLEADENFPDSCFVEDTAVVTEKMAVITRPGASQRRGEESSIREVLSKFKKIELIQEPGTVDGGDIMRMDDHFFIGLSARTNIEGAHQLAVILQKYGYSSSEIKVETLVHLKSGITYLGKGNFIAVGEFAKKFSMYSIIPVDQDEAYSANSLVLNDNVLVSKGFPKTNNRIRDLGYNIIELEMSEFQKMDGALTCLSLLF
jgi:dimethylargininase